MEFFLLFVLKNDGSIVAILFCFVYHLFRFTSYHSKNKSKEMKRKLIFVTFFTFAQISHIFPNSKHSFFLIYLL